MAPKVTSIKGKAVGKRKRGELAPLIRKTKLRYPELSESQIARHVGCGPSHVHRVLAKFLGTDHSEQDLRDYQESKADIFDAVAMKAVMSITPEKLEKSSPAALMMVAGTAFDKSQLVRGQATQINVSVLLDAVSAIREMRDKG